MVRSRAAAFVGKRSGVQLDLPQQPNDGESIKEGDLNAFFKAAAAASKTKPISKNNEETTIQKKKPPASSRNMRFSLEGQPSFPDNQTFNHQNTASSGMFGKIRNFSGVITEADLSPVSAASPVPVEPKSDKKPSPVAQEDSTMEDVEEEKKEDFSDEEMEEESHPSDNEEKEEESHPSDKGSEPPPSSKGSESPPSDKGAKSPPSEKEEEEVKPPPLKKIPSPLLPQPPPLKKIPSPLPPQPAQEVEVPPQEESVDDPPLPQDDYEDGEYEEPDDPMIPLDDEDDDGANNDGGSHVSGSNDDLIPPAPPDSPGDHDNGTVEETESAPKANKNPEPVDVVEEKKASPIRFNQGGPSLSDDDDSYDAEEEVIIEPKKSKPKPEKSNPKPKPEKSNPKPKPEKPKLKPKPEKLKPKKEKKKLKSFVKKEKEKKKRELKVEDESENESLPQRSVAVDEPPKKKQKKVSRFTTTFSPKGIPLPREYETIPVSDLKETPPPGVRRSSRARLQPLAYWKGEKAEYGPLDDDEMISSDLFNMPVVKGYVRAKETPYKIRKIPSINRSKQDQDKKNKTKNNGSEVAPAQTIQDYDSTKIRKKHKYNDGEEAILWDEGDEESKDLKVVSYHANMDARRLPLSKTRSKSDGKAVGKAAQAFNVPNGPKPQYVGYITGSLALPPKGIKDAESVGACAQVFTVVTCQPGGLEVAYADPEDDSDDATFNPNTAERFLLKPRDMFRVPPGNAYRLCNHSKSIEAFLTWTIIRPAALPASHDDNSSQMTPR